jgi:hypothetical protein
MQRAAILRFLVCSFLAYGGQAASSAAIRHDRDGFPPVQQAQAGAKSTGRISGRITIQGKPTAGIAITLTADNRSYLKPRLIKTTTSDQEGRYLFDLLPTHHYWLHVEAPGFVPRGRRAFEEDRTVSVSDGAMVAGVYVDLIPGGIVSGRIIDTEGNPVQGESVHLIVPTGRDVLVADPGYMDVIDGETDSNGGFRLAGPLRAVTGSQSATTSNGLPALSTTRMTLGETPNAKGTTTLS